MLILWLLCYLVSSSIYHNVTKSEKLGYYFAYPAFAYKNGDLVLLCINDARYVNVMRQLGLRPVHDNDKCIGNMPYLLKKIIAVPGDIVNITSKGISVNNLLYRNSRSITLYKGVNLMPQKYQQFTLHSGEFFVLGEVATSFDSRYFGVVHVEQIAKKALFIKNYNL